MKRFARLFAELDASTATNAKLAALDSIPEWLFEACYQAVGDLAETIAHVLPLRGADPAEQSARIALWFDELDAAERFLFVKLIGDGFRVGVSKLLVQRALAAHAGLDAKLVAQRMMGYTDAKAAPDAAAYARLLAPAGEGRSEPGQPYPFFLAHALDVPPAEFEARLGPSADWLLEWKYDGIRAQLVRRDAQAWIGSRGEELVTERFPEVVQAAQALPDGTVLDGEIVVWKDARLAPFNLLQRRSGRKTLGKRVLADAPVAFIAYDLLESALLGTPLQLSPLAQAADWAAFAGLRSESRERGVEGFMLKHREARYGSGRTKADDTWWKWKIEPLSVDAVLDAIERREPAQPGALQLVTFAKACSGLSDAEFAEVDRVIRQTTIEKFGPVRSVKPSLQFELGFEGISRSPRHRSGIAVRFPRMMRIRSDKPLHEADTLGHLEALLSSAGAVTIVAREPTP